MALYRLMKRDSRRASECFVSILKNGILAINTGSIQQFKLTDGRIALFGDDEIEDRIAFRFVDETEADESEACILKPQKDKHGKLTAYHASVGSFLSDHPLYEAGETTSYPLRYDPDEEAYYFLLSTGKVTSRKRGANNAKTEVKKVLEASSSSAETDGAGDEEAAA